MLIHLWPELGVCTLFHIRDNLYSLSREELAKSWTDENNDHNPHTFTLCLKFDFTFVFFFFFFSDFVLIYFLVKNKKQKTKISLNCLLQTNGNDLNLTMPETSTLCSTKIEKKKTYSISRFRTKREKLKRTFCTIRATNMKWTNSNRTGGVHGTDGNCGGTSTSNATQNGGGFISNGNGTGVGDRRSIFYTNDVDSLKSGNSTKVMYSPIAYLMCFISFLALFYLFVY